MKAEELLSLIDYGASISGQPLTKADQIELIRKFKSEWCKQQKKAIRKEMEDLFYTFDKEWIQGAVMKTIDNTPEL